MLKVSIALHNNRCNTSVNKTTPSISSFADYSVTKFLLSSMGSEPLKTCIHTYWNEKKKQQQKKQGPFQNTLIIAFININTICQKVWNLELFLTVCTGYKQIYMVIEQVNWNCKENHSSKLFVWFYICITGHLRGNCNSLKTPSDSLLQNNRKIE